MRRAKTAAFEITKFDLVTDADGVIGVDDVVKDRRTIMCSTVSLLMPGVMDAQEDELDAAWEVFEGYVSDMPVTCICVRQI